MLVISSVAPLSQLPTVSERPFRHAAALAIEEGQYSEPLLFKKERGVILHNLGYALGVQAG